MTLLGAAQAVDGSRELDAYGSPLVFLGTYTDHSVLPHWPRGHKQGEGIVVCRWREGKLNVVRTVPCLNPAFMK